jgi:zinc protease
LAVLPAWARQLPDSNTWPQEQSDLPPDPAVVWGKLDNGMRYVLLPNDTPKGRISLRLLVAAGSLMETEDQRGLAHFLEHMAFKGSQNLPAGDLVHYLERLGMAFGADTNARTSYESTVFQLDLAANDPELVDKSLTVMRETADRLLILASELDKERGVILSEKRLRDAPDYRSFTENIEFLLPGTLVPERSPIGVASVIESAPRQRLVDFYRTWYRPERITLVVVGAMDPVQFAGHIKEHFDSLRATMPSQPNPELGTIARRGPSAHLHSDPDAQTRVSLETVVDLDPHADTRASRAQEANLYLANAVLSRRLATLTLKGDASFISGSAQTMDLLRFVRIGSVTLQCKPEQWSAALATAEQELRRALTYGFTPAELEEQKKNLLSYLEQQAKSASTRESPELANDLVEHLSSFSVFTHPDYDLAEFGKILGGVTAQSAQQALRELWSAGGPLAFVSGPITLKQPEGEILQVLADSSSKPVTPPKDGDLQKFAYTDFGTATPVVEKKIAALDVTQVRFGNNVRLNLKQTKFDANSILVAIRFGGGRLDLPRDKPGLKLLADQTFVSGGLQQHNVDDLSRLTAGRNVGVDFTVEDDAFVLTGRTTPADLLLQLQMMAAYITAPGYRPEALERFHQGLASLYLNLTRTPGGVMQSQVSRFLHDGDSRFGVPDQDDAAKRTLDELKAWLAEPLAASYMEVSIVGDFDPEAALKAVNSTLGSLAPRAAAKPAYAEQRKVRFPSERKLKTFTFDARDPKAYATVYWPTTDFSHTSDVRRLFVLAKVLEGRILERIRIQQGLSYTAQGGNSPSTAFPGMDCCTLWSTRLRTKLRCWRWKYAISPVGSRARASPRTNWSGRATRW